jgi:hypothetical protein
MSTGGRQRNAGMTMARKRGREFRFHVVCTFLILAIFAALHLARDLVRV